MIFKGLTGRICQTNEVSPILVNCESVEPTLRDSQGLGLPVSCEAVVTVSNAPGTTALTGLAEAAITVTVQWGSNGAQHELGPIPFTHGMTIPVKGSWFRVSVNNSSASGPTLGFSLMATIAFGTISDYTVVRGRAAEVTCGGAAVASFQLPGFRNFVKAIRVAKSNVSADNIGTAGGGGYLVSYGPIVVDVAGGGMSDWIDVLDWGLITSGGEQGGPSMQISNYGGLIGIADFFYIMVRLAL